MQDDRQRQQRIRRMVVINVTQGQRQSVEKLVHGQAKQTQHHRDFVRALSADVMHALDLSHRQVAQHGER